MKFIAALLLFVCVCESSSFARRANPNINSNPHAQYFLIDSDDDFSGKPVYAFVDTTFGSWHRVTGFTHPDTGYAHIQSASTLSFNFYDRYITLPPAYVHVNGMLSFDSITPGTFQDTLFTMLGGLSNALLPRGSFSMLSPLWANLELRTTGDSSRIYYRITADSCLVSFYNMALKASNGRVRATFQVVFAMADSSITIQYRSFDGTVDGETAAHIFQRLSTIGVQDTLGSNVTNYLDRGIYSAFSKASSPSQFETNLHNSLAVKFARFTRNSITLRSLIPGNGSELPGSAVQPTINIGNNTDTTQRIYVLNEIFAANGTKVYSRVDSLSIDSMGTANYVGVASNLLCGAYRMVSSITAPYLGADVWNFDNSLTTNFVRLTELTLPYLEDFKTLSPCSYNVGGATLSTRAEDVMRDPAAPYETGAVVFDRKSAKGVDYNHTTAGDTLTTSFFNLQGKANVWLIFSYQRGLRNDSIQAGIRARKLVGPELKRTSSDPSLLQGDSLVIEALQSTGSIYNPASFSWSRIASIPGGIDLVTKKFRIQIPSAYVHNHSRFRIRLAARNNGPVVGLPFDDADPFVIDALQITAPTSGKETDVEPTGLELGSKYYTHIPRDVKFITPKVRIASNGLQANSAVYQVRLILWDALGREVYHQKKSLVSPDPHSDVELSMLSFPIEGSQGGVFTARVSVEQMFSDYYRANDTNTFYRTLAIDDVYAFDDGQPDTAGTMTAATESVFTYNFRPLRTDSLRGMEFYHLTASGNTNWVIKFKRQDTTRYTRGLTYDVLDRGFHRVLFNKPVPLSADSTYAIEFNLIQGFSLAGDASLGLVAPVQDSSYWLLYPNALADFSDNGSGNYANTTSPKNATGGGPLLPMVRLVYRGSATYLPVELVSLRAKRLGVSRAAIDFATAAESETHHFRIERFSHNAWEEIADISSANNLYGATYSAVDDKAPASEVLYRLTSVDLDGSEHILGTIALGPVEAAAPHLIVTPNPAHAVARLTLPAIGPAMSVNLYDVTGRNARSAKLDASDPLVDLEGLAQGLYMVEVIVGSDRYYTKLWVE